MQLPVTEWSDNLVGGVWAGVWWCDGLSPSPEFGMFPYKALKSSGVLLHFRWPPDPLLLLSPGVWWPAELFRTSWARPRSRFSWEEMPISRLSWRDMNLDSCPLPCCKLPCARAWSSRRPCWRPRSPPTRLGRRSSISFPWPQELAVKFNWRLKIAGNMLNCCESLALDGLKPRLDECEIDDGTCCPTTRPFPLLPPSNEPPIPAFPAAAQLVLKSNLVPSE